MEAELSGATRISNGENFVQTADGGAYRFSELPSWTPDGFRDAGLMTRVLRNVSEGKAPRANAGKEIELQKLVEDRIAARADEIRQSDGSKGVFSGDAAFAAALMAGGTYYVMAEDGSLLPVVGATALMANPVTRNAAVKQIRSHITKMEGRVRSIENTKGFNPDKPGTKHRQLMRAIDEAQAERVRIEKGASFNEGGAGRQDLPADKRPGIGLSTQDRGAFGKGEQEVFNNFPDLSVKHLNALEGKGTVNKQFILDTANRPELKQPERDLIRAVVDEFPDGKINVQEYADKIKARLLPLTAESMKRAPNEAGGLRYESVNLDPELRGNVARYDEKLYESPIANSAGSVHFDHLALGEGDNYFAHTRIEDMADGKTRRVIEAQSDLFQKGRLDDIVNKNDQREIDSAIESLGSIEEVKKTYGEDYVDQVAKQKTELAQLQPYRNTWWERIVREEVKSAAADGKTKLQFPTGETAMKIEGLGDNQGQFIAMSGADLTPADLKVGEAMMHNNSDWIITEVLDDGKFKAVPKRVIDRQPSNWEITLETRDGKKLSDNHTGAGVWVARNRKVGGQEFQEFAEGNKDEALNFFKQSKVGLKDRSLDELAESYGEQFDISGKVDTNNPIYRFYEKDVQKYLNKNYNAKQVTDENGVTWIEFDVDKGKAQLPVEAFGLVAAVGGGAYMQSQE